VNKADALYKMKQYLKIANYSDRSISNYLSALNKFLDYIIVNQFKDINDTVIKEYLYHCKTGVKYATSSMK
jgi:site-specific recombinase XerD